VPDPLLEIRDLSCTLSGRPILRNITLEVQEGETIVLLGRSGSGKTTLLKSVNGLIPPSSGTIHFEGRPATDSDPIQLRRRMGYVIQDAGLFPHWTVDANIGLVPRLEAWPPDRVTARTTELLQAVGLEPNEFRTRFPRSLSGGQRQRVGIARALATGPRLVIADEPVSALDVSIRAQIVNLLAELQARLGLAMLFIAHDLALVEQLADRVAVMYLGKVVELGPCAEVLARPQHPYTVSLLDSVPVPDPGHPLRAALAGDPPSPAAPPSGCRFHPRCPIARPRCATDEPALLPVGAGLAACHYAGELKPEWKHSGAAGVESGRIGPLAGPDTDYRTHLEGR